MSYYAVAKGHNVGIYLFWDDCKNQVIGYKGAIYKKFKTEEDAEDFILNINNTKSLIFENVYNKFDDNEAAYYVYTDGSCYNNGKSNAIAGIGIFFDIDDDRNVSKIITSNYSIQNKVKLIHTNNSAELIAIIECYKLIKNDTDRGLKVVIMSDSEYSIKCATSYGDKLSKDNWSKDVPNKELIIELYEIYKNNENLKIKHIKAHTTNNDIHSLGNKNADILAYNAIKKYRNQI